MNNKIGILTHFNVCNFGANLQALSTSEYLRKAGYDPIFINWIGYQKELFLNVSSAQQLEHSSFLKTHLHISEPLGNDDEIAGYLKRNSINNIIVGSDAVFSLATIGDRFNLNKSGFHVNKIGADKVFPNPYWLSFIEDKENFVCVAMSPSCQNSFYYLFPHSLKLSLKKSLSKFSYLSARDKWTANMIKAICNVEVDVTPDPMWGFNYNYKQNICQEDFLQRFNIHSKYLLLGFQQVFDSKTGKWIKAFVAEAHKKGYQCISLPFPFGGFKSSMYDGCISLPLNPLDWYNLIRFSNGYIGYNMHPIIVALHNNVPCFAVDNYGVNIFKYFNVAASSKIFDILDQVDLLANRKTLRYFFDIDPSSVLGVILNHDNEKGVDILESQYGKYLKMMNSITSLFS